MEKKKQRRGILKLISRRTFFDLQTKPELAEIPDTQTEDTAEVSREEQSKKANIFGLKFKNEKDFRREYFHKHLLVPEALQMLNSES